MLKVILPLESRENSCKMSSTRLAKVLMPAISSNSDFVTYRFSVIGSSSDPKVATVRSESVYRPFSVRSILNRVNNSPLTRLTAKNTINAAEIAAATERLVFVLIVAIKLRRYSSNLACVFALIDLQY